MIKFDCTNKITIISYIIVILILYIIKPKYMFTDDGNLKHFGLKKNNTIIPIWLFAIIISLFIYLLIILKLDNFISK